MYDTTFLNYGENVHLIKLFQTWFDSKTNNKLTFKPEIGSLVYVCLEFEKAMWLSADYNSGVIILNGIQPRAFPPSHPST